MPREQRPVRIERDVREYIANHPLKDDGLTNSEVLIELMPDEPDSFTGNKCRMKLDLPLAQEINRIAGKNVDMGNVIALYVAMDAARRDVDVSDAVAVKAAEHLATERMNL